MRLELAVPPGFSFAQTVRSHGWGQLEPFHLGADASRLECVIPMPGGGARPIVLAPCAAGVRLSCPGSAVAGERRSMRAAARRMLNLDLDLSGFYGRVRPDTGLRWIAAAGAGRLLRCATAFEDLVKLVLTTNCSWALTQRMVRSLVERYGAPAPDGSRAFPGPEAIAAAGARGLRARGRVGYRAPLLAELARRVADGRVHPEAWDAPKVDAGALKAELLELPGVGPYVAESMLKLLGKPDGGLALDSALRAKYARVYHEGRRVTDRTIARRYARLGRWAGLVLWCEMTRDRVVR